MKSILGSVGRNGTAKLIGLFAGPKSPERERNPFIANLQTEYIYIIDQKL